MSWQSRVKKLMQSQKMTQKELSKLSGITEASVSRYLTSEGPARMDIIVNFAKVLGVTPDYYVH